MRLETCHLFIRRILERLVAGPENYCFKIDPDTKICRRFWELPTEDAMFGTLELVSEGMAVRIDGPPNVQGGCIGMTRNVAASILASGLLTREFCCDRALETWARCEDMRRTVARGQFCDDFVLSWLADRCGFSIIGCAEILSTWRRPAREDGAGRLAVTHPHKHRPTEQDAALAIRKMLLQPPQGASRATNS